MTTTGGLVLGIDIGWSERKKTTGVCLLAWDANSVSLNYERIGTESEQRRKDLRRLIGGRPLLAAAIDGPMRPGLDEIGEYRDAELILTRRFQRIGKPGQSNSGNGRKLNQTANAVARTLLDMNILGKATHAASIHDCALVEAFPTSYLAVMLDEEEIPTVPNARSDAYFEHLLGPDLPRPQPPQSNRLAGLVVRLLPNRRLNQRLTDCTHHEDRAAAVCAVTALSITARSYVAVGDRRNGYIILPPLAEAGAAGLQPWAWQILNGSHPANSENAIIREPERETGTPR